MHLCEDVDSLSALHLLAVDHVANDADDVELLGAAEERRTAGVALNRKRHGIANFFQTNWMIFFSCWLDPYLGMGVKGLTPPDVPENLPPPWRIRACPPMARPP